MMTSTRSCPAPIQPNDDQGWLGREPTDDEQEILAWLRARPLPERILHVGVGNALLTRELGSRVSLGLSRDGGEVVNAARLGLGVILCNKYDVPSYRQHLNNSFDCIVDPNVRSYSCCTHHFVEYMDVMLSVLSSRGCLVTSRRGLAYLVPTSLSELAVLCPAWRIRAYGNVVVMKPGIVEQLRRWWDRKRRRTTPA